jgi:hypothetical protein
MAYLRNESIEQIAKMILDVVVVVFDNYLNVQVCWQWNTTRSTVLVV